MVINGGDMMRLGEIELYFFDHYPLNVVDLASDAIIQINDAIAIYNNYNSSKRFEAEVYNLERLKQQVRNTNNVHSELIPLFGDIRDTISNSLKGVTGRFK